jgi:hypothetical protein
MAFSCSLATILVQTVFDSAVGPVKRNARETLENQADLRDNEHVIVGAHWGDGQ